MSPTSPAPGPEDDGDHAEALERAYRRWLFLYPRHWRAHREEELLSVLIAGAQERGRRRPSAGEVLDLLGNGADAHLAHHLRAVPRVVRERTALLALTSGAMLSAVLLLLAELPVPGALPATAFPEHAAWAAGMVGPLSSTGALVYLPWLVAYALFLAGRANPARLVVLVSLVTTVACLILASCAGLNRPSLALLGALAAFAALTLAGRPPSGRLARRWSASVGLVLAAALVVYDLPRMVGTFDARAWQYTAGGLVNAPRLSSLVLVPGLLVAAGASVMGRAWLVAAWVTFVPWAYLWIFSAWATNLSAAVLPAVVLTVVVTLVGALTVAMEAADVRLVLRGPLGDGPRAVR